MKQLPLPYSQRIIFVDWHGVISKDPFWTSILGSKKHPLYSQLEEKLSDVFSCEETTHDWMKGIISTHEIISEMGIWMDQRFQPDFLLRRLEIDCTRMHVNMELLEVLGRFKYKVPIVLATDNMDCFARSFNRSREKSRNSKKQYESHMADWAIFFDDIVCSSDVGTLKAENPFDFFTPLLSEYWLQFSDALLIDDRADNCEAFRRLGGRAIQWKMGSSNIKEIVETLIHWL